MRNRHGGAVEALGFAALVEADDGDHRISGVGGGERFGFVDERLVLGSLAVVALRVAGHGHAGGCCGVLELIKDVLFASGIHLGRAGALESRGFGHVADYGHTSAGLQRQRGGSVLEQHGRVLGHLASDFVVRSGDGIFEQVVAANAFGFGPMCNLGDFGGTSVEVGLGQGAGLDRAFEFAHGGVAGARHFERATGLDRGHGGVGAAPVGNDHAIETPLIAQDVLQQVLVLVRVNAIDLVV